MHASTCSHAALLDTAHSLHVLGSGRRHRLCALRVAADRALLAVVDVGTRRLRSSLPLGQLVDALAETHMAFTELLQSADEYLRRPSPGFADESFDRLCWLFGGRLARDTGLAPWLDPGAGYRLLCWPDFGEIGTDVQGARLCAMLAQRDLKLAALTEALDLPATVVCGLVNSLSLCGVLAAGSPRPAPKGSATRRTISSAEQHGLFDRLCERLGVRRAR